MNTPTLLEAAQAALDYFEVIAKASPSPVPVAAITATLRAAIAAEEEREKVTARIRAAIAAEEEREAPYHLAPPSVRCIDCGNRYRYTPERWAGVNKCEGCGGDGYRVSDGWKVDPETSAAVERVRGTR
jgi:hypothetical protein